MCLGLLNGILNCYWIKCILSDDSFNKKNWGREVGTTMGANGCQWREWWTGNQLCTYILVLPLSGGPSIVKCCSWVRSFPVLFLSDIPCVAISLVAVHARDGERKSKPTLWSLSSWDFSATSNRPVSFLEQLRRLSGILVFGESHQAPWSDQAICGLVV